MISHFPSVHIEYNDCYRCRYGSPEAAAENVTDFFITIEHLLTPMVTFDPRSKVSQRMPHLGFDLDLLQSNQLLLWELSAQTASGTSKGMLLRGSSVDSVIWENTHTPLK